MTRADFLLRGAGRLVTCARDLGDGPLGVIERGAVAALDGEIVWAGAERDLAGAVEVARDAVEVDAGGRAVIPGLVDCHTHLVFAGDRSAEFAARLRGEPYRTGGVMTTVTATRAASDRELERLARERLDRFASFGVTTVEAKTGYGLTARDEMRLLRVIESLDHHVRVVPTFMGAHVVPPDHPGGAEAYVDDVCESMIPAIGSRAEFVDVWCEAGAFSVAQSRRVLDAARAGGFRAKVHAEQLARTGGAALAAETGAVSADHLEYANEEDAEALARAGVVAVLLPGASLTTGAPFARARMLIERGARVALSTDFNPGTSYSENLPLVVVLACAHLGVTPEEAILGVTRHAAAALAREGRIGSIEPGASCDLVVLDAATEIDLAYHYGVNLAREVVARGRVLDSCY